MITILVKIVHLMVCIGLIVVVLLQADKGEGLAGAFGSGASGAVFGDRGDSGGFMTKVTTGMAVIFMLTSLVLSIYVPVWEKSANGVEMSSPRGNAPGAQTPELPLPMGLPISGGGGEQAPQPVAPHPPAPVPGQ